MATSGEEEVEDDLGIESPVAGVVENEDSVDFDILMVGIGNVFEVTGREDLLWEGLGVWCVDLFVGKRPEGWEGGYKIRRREDIGKAVAVEYLF